MNKSSFHILGSSIDGSITVLINHIKYRYWVDPLIIERIKRLANHRPGQTLNLLKTKCYDWRKIVD